MIGATNRIDSLDGALRRPGRFDRELLFPLPGLKVRVRQSRPRSCIGELGKSVAAVSPLPDLEVNPSCTSKAATAGLPPIRP